MRSFMLLVFSFVYTFNHIAVDGVLTESQLQATVKLVRKTCQPKNKATDEDIDKMHKGDWNVDRTAMCYMYCALNMNRLITKENKLDYETAIAMGERSLADNRKIPLMKSLDMCRDAAKTLNDKCAAAWELCKCFYESNPANYFLP